MTGTSWQFTSGQKHCGSGFCQTFQRLIGVTSRYRSLSGSERKGLFDSSHRFSMPWGSILLHGKRWRLLFSMRVLRESLAIIAPAVVIGSVSLSWTHLPARVPTHFGLSGPPNSFGPKSSIWILPVVAIVSYIGLTFVNRFPRAFNYPVKITKENQARLEPLGVALVGWLKAEVLWVFAWMTLTTVNVALGHSSGLSAVFLPVSLGVVAITVGFFWRWMLRVA